jgi:hypothetical protein
MSYPPDPMRSFALALVLATLPPSLAAAQQPRVLVLPFAGSGAGAAHGAVTDALMTEVQLVREDTAMNAAADLGVDVSTSEGFAQLVQHLEIQLVVAGEIQGRGSRATTTILVLDAHGDELARRSGPSPSGASRLAEIGAAAVGAIQDALAEIERRENPEPEPQPVAPPDPVSEPEPEPSEPATTTSGWAQKQLLLLAGIRLRNAGTYVFNDIGVREGYFEADVYPEIDLELVFRPWLQAEDALRGLMFALQGSFSVGMAYFGPDGSQRGMTSYRFEIDLAYGIPVADVVEIVAGAGFGLEGISLDVGDAFPSTLFTFIRPLVMGRFRIVPDFLIAEAGVGARIGLDGGPINAAYGPSLYFGGVDFFAGVSGSIAEGFAWAARAGYTYQALDFAGSAGLLANGDTGSDQGVDIRILVGWTM